MDTMDIGKGASRRRYSAPLKAQIMAECEAPGASVARVAMAHGINANVVHSWRRRAAGSSDAGSVSGVFVPVSMDVAAQAQAQAHAPEPIRVELRRGALSLMLAWPISAAADLAHWTQAVLR